MVELKNVTLTYNGVVEGVSDLSLTIEDGEFCFIIGRSGSGKSTFSKLLTGELKPQYGTVKVNGYPMEQVRGKTKAEARRTIGMVFQDFRLIREMTAYENLEFAARCVGISGEGAEKRIADVLDLVGLSGKEDRYPRELSGGEQQRVAIARALINRPELLIADEPTGNLDPELARSIIDLFFKINALGTTVLVITHAKALVEQYNARVLALSDGKLVQDKKGTYAI